MALRWRDGLLSHAVVTFCVQRAADTGMIVTALRTAGGNGRWLSSAQKQPEKVSLSPASHTASYTDIHRWRAAMPVKIRVWSHACMPWFIFTCRRHLKLTLVQVRRFIYRRTHKKKGPSLPVLDKKEILLVFSCLTCSNCWSLHYRGSKMDEN